MDVLERILQIGKEQNLSVRALERAIGKGNGYFSTIKKQGSVMGIDVVLNIIEKYPQYSLVWILTEKGDKIISPKELKGKGQGENVTLTEIVQKMDGLEKSVTGHFDGLQTVLTTLLKENQQHIVEIVKSVANIEMELDEIKK